MGVLGIEGNFKSIGKMYAYNFYKNWNERINNLIFLMKGK